VSSTGIKTHRDHFVIDFDKEALKRRIRTFLDPSLPDEFVRETFKLKDNRDWKLSEKRKVIAQNTDWESNIVQCLCRPFDVRWLFNHYDAIDFGREDVMKHILCRNLALITPRQNKNEFGGFVSVSVGTHKTVAAFDTNYYFPLFCYTTSEELSFKTSQKDTSPNLDLNLLRVFKTTYSVAISPQEAFSYIYSIIYSNVYRKKYTDQLQIDFPRIPFTRDFVLFQKLAGLGERLVDLHLLRSAELDSPIARFQGEGDNRVQTGKKGLRYDAEAQRVYINEEQYFEGVPPQVWEYPIGGYQVCHKWLKDRKDRNLTLEEIKTYCRIVTALSKTIEIQAEIDTLYPEIEKSLLPIKL